MEDGLICGEKSAAFSTSTPVVTEVVKVLLTGSWLDFFPALTVIFCHVQALVDDSWDGLDLCSQLLLDPFQVEAIIVSDEVDGESQVSEASWMMTRNFTEGENPSVEVSTAIKFQTQ